MCSGNRKPSPPPPAAVDFDLKKPSMSSLLLDLAASDDLPSFIRAVEEESLPIDAAALWYGRSVGFRRLGLDLRTPLQIAALYGSTAVLNYILSATGAAAVNSASGADGATPLHCAASGGSPSSLQAVRILLDCAADVDALDAAGNRPGDVIPRLTSAQSARSLLEIALQAPTRVSSPDPNKKGEKKEYPPDLTLPDIKNGIYGTDEFRMYTFKVKPCSRAYSHDWTECPFVHPGENARRRDPRKYLYSCVPCPEFRKGSCRNADSCEYAHGVFECWLHPAQYRTRLCKDEIGCNRRVCFFAHKPDELRSVNPSAASVAGLLPPSPRSPSLGLSSMDLATALMMMQTSAPSTPKSPASSAALPSSSPMWTGVSTPTLQLPSSRLKSSLSARDIDFDMELLGMGFDSPRSKSNLRVNSMAAASRASDYSDLIGSLDHSLMSPLQGLSMMQAASSAAQFQSSVGNQRHQAMSQQLLSGYGGGNLPSSSPTMNSSSAFGLDHSTAKAIMNSRSAALAKRSMSFTDRGVATVGRQQSLAPVMESASNLSDWGLSDGRSSDWRIHGDELSKLRKSASFGFGSQSGGFMSPAMKSPAMDEPDLSWVNSLVNSPWGAEQEQRA